MLRSYTVAVAVAALLVPAVTRAQDAAVYCLPNDFSTCFSLRYSTDRRTADSAIVGSLFVRNLEGDYTHGMYGGRQQRTDITAAAVVHYNDPALAFGVSDSYPRFRTVGSVDVATPPNYGSLGVNDLAGTDTPVQGTSVFQGWEYGGDGSLGSQLLGCTGTTGWYAARTCAADGFGGELGFDFFGGRYAYPSVTYSGLPTFDDYAVSISTSADGGAGCYALIGATSGIATRGGAALPVCVVTGDYIAADGSLVTAPEPATFALTAAALGGLGRAARSRREA